jgi:fatty acid desaturase
MPAPLARRIRPRAEQSRRSPIATASSTAAHPSRRAQRYAGTDTFPPLTQAYLQVAQVVRETGLLRRTPWFYSLVGAGLLATLAGFLTGSILLGHSWFQLLIAAGLGILFTQVAFLAHEAAHRQILATGPANDRLARALGAVAGMSYSWWDSKHTRHHANPNRVGKDPDIEVDTISFLAEDAAEARGLRAWITRRQGWLFFPLLTLEGLNLHFLSFRHLFSRGKVKGRWTELGLITLRFGLVLVPLFWLLPLGMAFAFLGVQLAVFSKQVRTSRNIAGGWWATWLMGGLNYQVEHHLFPSMPRPHLAKARRIVREQCERLAVPYTETSLWRSYGIVVSYLNRVGLAARDPFECPVTAAYRRT